VGQEIAVRLSNLPIDGHEGACVWSVRHDLEQPVVHATQGVEAATAFDRA